MDYLILETVQFILQFALLRTVVDTPVHSSSYCSSCLYCNSRQFTSQFKRVHIVVHVVSYCIPHHLTLQFTLVPPVVAVVHTVVHIVVYRLRVAFYVVNISCGVFIQSVFSNLYMRNHCVRLSRWTTVWGIMAQIRNLQTRNKETSHVNLKEIRQLVQLLMGLLSQRRAGRRDFDLKRTPVIFLITIPALDLILSESISFFEQSYIVNKQGEKTGPALNQLLMGVK